MRTARFGGHQYMSEMVGIGYPRENSVSQGLGYPMGAMVSRRGVGISGCWVYLPPGRDMAPEIPYHTHSSWKQHGKKIPSLPAEPTYLPPGRDMGPEIPYSTPSPNRNMRPEIPYPLVNRHKPVKALAACNFLGGR